MPELTSEEVLRILSQERPADNHPFKGQQIGACQFPAQVEYLADFEGATFTGDVSFSQTTFKQGVSFIGTVFHGIVTFTGAICEGPAFFWKCTFMKDFSFRRCTVLAKHHEQSRHCPGEANFSYTQFLGAVDFTKAQLHGVTFFHRTSFAQKADFEECCFYQHVKFQGSTSDICVSELEFSENLIQRLRQGNVISIQDAPKVGSLTFYKLNSSIETNDQLADWMHQPRRRRWAHPGIEISDLSARKNVLDEFFEILPSDISFSPNEVALVTELRNSYATPMFASDGRSTARFVKTEFRQGALFDSVNLDHARFQQTHLNNIVFDSVIWNRLPLTFGLGYRWALFDETLGITNPFLRQIYHDLRLNYEARGATYVARDFYYGELEVRYRSNSWFRRKFSLAFIYRYFSGFGRQLSLAGLWLAIFVLALFPLLWVADDWFNSAMRGAAAPGSRLFDMTGAYFKALFPRLFLHGLEQSLEACAFVNVGTTYRGLEGVLAGVERVVVALQLTLFLLAAKWQFQRNPGDSEY